HSAWAASRETAPPPGNRRGCRHASSATARLAARARGSPAGDRVRGRGIRQASSPSSPSSNDDKMLAPYQGGPAMLQSGRVAFGAMEAVCFGRPAAESVGEEARRRDAKRVLLMVSGTLNRATDEIAR